MVLVVLQDTVGGTVLLRQVLGCCFFGFVSMTATDFSVGVAFPLLVELRSDMRRSSACEMVENVVLLLPWLVELEFK